jgi:hypothetical protein
VKGEGAGLPTYSGRSIESGTLLRGLCLPGRSAGRVSIRQA